MNILSLSSTLQQVVMGALIIGRLLLTDLSEVKIRQSKIKFMEEFMKAMFNPSLMCMDLLDIKKQTEILNERCDLYHVDIMDGHFVKNITLSPDFVAAFAKIAKKPIDCHLMCEYPDDYIETLAKWPERLIYVLMQKQSILTHSVLLTR